MRKVNHRNSLSKKGMKKETDTICAIKKNGYSCRGALIRDERISRLEKSFNQRKYTCDKCGLSCKYT